MAWDPFALPGIKEWFTKNDGPDDPPWSWDHGNPQWFSTRDVIETGVNLPRILPMRPRKPAKRLGQ
jgi:hypothetical protein